jgi:hypothetical protein
MLDVAFPQKEDIQALLSRRDWYLSHNTGVNIWIGVKHFRESGLWWMGIARRDFDAVPPAVMSETWPPSIWMYQLPGVEYGEFESINTPRKEMWEIPSEMVFHPDPIPQFDPLDPIPELKDPLPEIVVMELEKFRHKILHPDEEGPMKLDYPDDYMYLDEEERRIICQ